MARPHPHRLFLGTLALALTGIVSVFYHKPGQLHGGPWQALDAGDATSQPPRRTNTLILSSWRSGSSFLGQLFNQHPGVFYLMEPMKHIWTKFDKTGESALRGAARDLLRSLCACDETALQFYIDNPRRLNSLFMFHSSTALCSVPACPEEAAAVANNSAGIQCWLSCGGAPFEGIGRACEQRRHTVIKSVRFFDISSLRPLVADPAVRLRIIHLVRDPRAVLSSRRKLKGYSLAGDDQMVLGRPNVDQQSDSVEVMQRICRGMDDIGAAVAEDAARSVGGRRGEEGGSDALRGAYMAVRYEDLVSRPERTTRDMFRFAGIELPAAVSSWVRDMTQGQREGPGGFEVERLRSLAVARKWRWSMSFEDARAAQDACRDAMRRFRYREFASEGELRNASVDAFY
ncbi:carbohydrate sulfotransferase 4-like [Petromyzon marinus]|uniref:carbohydrate sulfotransferase 4-like n=1 Tax=Petromyzon marinus TaxID=7757 RepID=UPI003F726834